MIKWIYRLLKMDARALLNYKKHILEPKYQQGMNTSDFVLFQERSKLEFQLE
jgi:hypothetical protein